MSAPDLRRRLSEEFLGSAFLATVVIASGIAGVLRIRFLYPALTPAQVADIVVPHAAPSAASLDGERPALVPDGTAG